MGKLCVVLIESTAFDYASAFTRAFNELNIDAEILKIPPFMPERLTPNELSGMKSKVKARKEKGKFVLFFPGGAEIFFSDPDWSFVCSHYKSWYDPKKTTVIPHVWTNIASPASTTSLQWNEKPPMRIGFMGTAFFDSRVGQIASKLPMPAKNWLLRGQYLRRIELLAQLNGFRFPLKHINTFPRSEALQILSARKRDVEQGSIEIVDTKGFTGSEMDKDRFVKHLQANTYIICPRGKENWSIRVYEALKYGRIPVIIDTDMVLPKEIDWDQVAIRIPYERLEETYDIILDDYSSRSADDFLNRQRAAFSTMSELESMRWLTDHLRNITAAI